MGYVIKQKKFERKRHIRIKIVATNLLLLLLCFLIYNFDVLFLKKPSHQCLIQRLFSRRDFRDSGELGENRKHKISNLRGGGGTSHFSGRMPPPRLSGPLPKINTASHFERVIQGDIQIRYLQGSDSGQKILQVARFQQQNSVDYLAYEIREILAVTEARIHIHHN